MFLAGTLIYVLVIASYFIFDPVQSMLNEALTLAPVITYAMLFLYIIPAAIHLTQLYLRKTKYENLLVLDKQTKLAASVSVSLGLIGTFQGLTSMVSSIAGSLGGEGDMMAQIARMMSSVSSALSAMSYAFLTSILGVSISVLLLLSLNFWNARYSKIKSTKDDESELERLSGRLATLSELCINLNNKLIVVSENKDTSEAALKALQDLHICLEQLLVQGQKSAEAQHEMLSEIKNVTQSILSEFCSRHDKLISECHVLRDDIVSSLEKGQADVHLSLNNVVDAIDKVDKKVDFSTYITRRGVQNLQDATKEYLSIKRKIRKAMELIYEK